MRAAPPAGVRADPFPITILGKAMDEGMNKGMRGFGGKIFTINGVLG